LKRFLTRSRILNGRNIIFRSLIPIKITGMKYNTIYLSLGTNVGDKEKNLTDALLELSKNHIRIVNSSSVYITEPVGPSKDQPEFLNMVLKAETDLSPEELIETILQIEEHLGRKRTIKKGPRLIDIDVLLYGSSVIKDPLLTVPHPEMHKRNFVLIPLQEIEPSLIHPVLKKRLEEFISNNTEKVILKT